MGHTRLGKIPTSKAWKEVVAIFAAARLTAGHADFRDLVEQIAAKTMSAAAGAIATARRDDGIGYIYYLLTQVALAARRADAKEALSRLGIELPDAPSTFDLTVGLHHVIDEHFLDSGEKSDLAEIGQLALGDIARVFQNHLSGRIADALDLAAIVYAADSAIQRGGAWLADGGVEPWARQFSFEIGVRDPDFWSTTSVQRLLKQTLGFLSDDVFHFSFERLISDRAVQQYINLGPASPADWPFQSPRRVLLFSGGLDSLAGAVEQASAGEKIVLVSHRSISNIDRRQQELYGKLKALFPTIHILRVPVWVNKAGGSRSREYTQRTRSFLFWAIALAVATSVNAQGMTFFENGVVSLNLPIADQVLRARASRTTHPETLRMLSELSALLTGREFVVENPFVLLTKAEVIKKIIDYGAGDLIRSSCSCSRTRAQRAVGWHCGCCSQCIDRRLAMISLGRTDLDPEIDYHVPVLTGVRENETDRIMAFSYVRHAIEMAKMSDEEMAERFNTEISRAAYAFPNPTVASQSLIDLHARHGRTICDAMTASVSEYARDIIEGNIAPSSLVGLICTRQHLQASWEQMAHRISIP